MNARLIGQLLDRVIEVQKITEYQKLLAVQMAELSSSPDPALDGELQIEGVSSLIIGSLVGAGYHTIRDVMKADPSEMPTKVPGVNYFDLADKIIEQYLKKKE
jgi:hypothetical protein